MKVVVTDRGVQYPQTTTPRVQMFGRQAIVGIVSWDSVINAEKL